SPFARNHLRQRRGRRGRHGAESRAYTFTDVKRRRWTSPAGWRGALETSATRQTCTSTLPRLPRALECHAARRAASSRTGRGSSSRASGLRTTTWLPGTPATCSQKSRGSATRKVRASLSASPFPTRTSNPPTSTARWPRPLLAKPSILPAGDLDGRGGGARRDHAALGGIVAVDVLAELQRPVPVHPGRLVLDVHGDLVL